MGGWNKSGYSINYPLIIRQCRLNYPLIKNGCLNAAFSFNFLLFCNRNLVPCYYRQLRLLFTLWGFKKCTTQPDNHFYSSGPREEPQRQRGESCEASTRTAFHSSHSQFILKLDFNNYNSRSFCWAAGKSFFLIDVTASDNSVSLRTAVVARPRMQTRCRSRQHTSGHPSVIWHSGQFPCSRSTWTRRRETRSYTFSNRPLRATTKTCTLFFSSLIFFIYCSDVSSRGVKSPG